jgi:signal transduction histidine kinase
LIIEESGRNNKNFNKMKKLLFILLIAILAIGCRSTKTTTKSNIDLSVQTETITEKTEQKDIKTTSEKSENVKAETSAGTLDITFAPTDKPLDLSIQDDGQGNVNIKSTTPVEKVNLSGSKSTGEKNTTEATKEEDKSKVAAKTNQKNNTNLDVKTKVTEEKKIDIPWWVFVIAGLLVIAGAYALLKKFGLLK